MRLNLPEFDTKLRRDASGRVQIYDDLRHKFVALTPEEWVRQHFVNYLAETLGYPRTLMANEMGLKLNGTQRRCDTVVFDRQAKPIAIAEYKAPDVNITQRVFDQIVRYNMVLDVKCLMMSNGLTHYCCLINGATQTYRFLTEIPTYEQLLVIDKC